MIFVVFKSLKKNKQERKEKKKEKGEICQEDANPNSYLRNYYRLLRKTINNTNSNLPFLLSLTLLF